MMKTVRRIVKNTAVRTATEILNLILSTIFLAYVARHLGSADFGKYAFALSFAGLFVIFADMGLHTIFIREAAREKERAGKLLGNLFVIKFVLVLFTFIAIFVAINLIGYSYETKRLVYIMGIFVIGTSLLDLFNSLFRAFERMEYESLIMFLNRLTVVASGIFILHLGYGVYGFTITILAANLLSLIPSSILAFRNISIPTPEFDKVLWKSLFREAFPVGLMMLFTAVYLKAGIIILSVLKDDSAVGLYSAPHRLIEALLVFPTFFLAALFPVFTRFYHSSRDSLIKAYEGVLKFLLILSLPMAVATTVLADKFIVIIFGDEFSNSVPVLIALIWACLFMFLNTLLSQLIIAMGKQRVNIISFGISALTNIIFNFALIPLYSYIGAGIALVGSQIILFVLNFIFVSSRLFRLPLHRMVLKPLLSSLFLGCVIWYIKEINLFFLIPIGFVVYFAILISTRTFSQEDIMIAKGLAKLR